MFKKIYILFSVLVLLATCPSIAQDERQCISTKALYKADGEQGSTYSFELLSGGSITSQDRNKGELEVQWGDKPGFFNLGVLEASKYGCYALDWAYREVELVGIVFDHPEIEICPGDSALVQFNKDIFDATSWSDPSVQKSGYVSKAGTYTVSAIFDGSFGKCRVSNTISVVNKPHPRVSLGADTVICDDRFMLIADKYHQSPQGTIFTWSTGETGEASSIEITGHNPLKKAMYWVNADFDGCFASDTIVILACSDDNPIVKEIPNTFTPNGDGDNDTWEIKVLKDYPNAVVEIFDRWGRKVFNSPKGYPQPWNGRDTKGHIMPMETYYYIINLNDGSKSILGTITIIR